MIKPDFWIDEKLGKMPEATQLLYIGLWCVADDEYRMVYDLERIAVSVWPYKRLSNKEIEKRMQPLLDAKRIVVYRVAGQTYAWLPKMGQHQKIQHPTPSKLPAPDDAEESGLFTNIHEDSGNVTNPHPSRAGAELSLKDSLEYNSKRNPPRGGERVQFGKKFGNVWLKQSYYDDMVSEQGQAVADRVIAYLDAWKEGKLNLKPNQDGYIADAKDGSDASKIGVWVLKAILNGDDLPGGNSEPAYVEDEHDIWMRETREKIANGEYVPEPPPPITDGWSR
jgi:hypothetical protein